MNSDEEMLTLLFGFGATMFFFMLAIVAVMIVAYWRVFAKAGQPGWAAIVPVYNIIVLLQIVGRPLWFIVLFFVPLANLVAAIIVSVDLARSFGKGAGFAAGLIFLFPIFVLILAFGDARYVGPGALAPVPPPAPAI